MVPHRFTITERWILWSNFKGDRSEVNLKLLGPTSRVWCNSEGMSNFIEGTIKVINVTLNKTMVFTMNGLSIIVYGTKELCYVTTFHHSLVSNLWYRMIRYELWKQSNTGKKKPLNECTNTTKVLSLNQIHNIL